MRVLVTGASGQLGPALVRRLVELGHDVRGLSRSEAADRRIEEAGGRPVRGDLLEPDSLGPALEGVEAIYHLAGGKRGPGRITADVLNVDTTRNLLAALGDRPLQTFLFPSSVAVYGDRSNTWVEEDFAVNPNTDYGRAKLEAENLLRAAQAERGLPLRVARVGWVYHPDFAWCLVEPIRKGNAWLPGEGRNHLPTIHLEDAVEALIHVAERAPVGDIVHVADTSDPTMGEFYDLVAQAVGGEPPTFWSTWIPSYVQRAVARTNERVMSALGRKPRFTRDNLLLFTASVRLKVRHLEEDLGFRWKHPDVAEGVASLFRSA